MNGTQVRELGEALKMYETAQTLLTKALRRAASDILDTPKHAMHATVRRRTTTARGTWTNDGHRGRPHLQIGAYVSHKVRHGKKVCTKCQMVKTASAFGPRGKRLQSWCKWCLAMNARQRTITR